MNKPLQKSDLKKCSTIFLVGAALLISINSQAQNISTIAGNGTAAYNGDGILATSAEINSPSGVAMDKLGNIYIADNANNRIRKIDHTTGIITTIAGTGTGGYNGDGILATTAELNNPWNVYVDKNGNIYIGDRTNSRIRKVDVSTGMISTIAGTGTAGYTGDGVLATTAELDSPQSMAMDSTGNLYFADVDNHRIRMINPAGYISTIAGNGTPGYNGDGIMATAAELHNPCSVALDSSRNIYIADYFNNEVRKVTVSTGIITSVAGNTTGGYNGDGIAATTAEVYNPTGVTIDGNQNIYITDYSNNRVRRVKTSTGIITTVAGTGTAGYNGDGILATTAEINNPWDVIVRNDAVYFAENHGDRIRKVPLITTGIDEVSNGISVAVYPNPTSSNLNIQMQGTNGQNSISLFNALGQQVLQKYLTEKTTSISVDNLSNGVYFLKILTQDGSILTRKVCIAK